MRTHGGEGAPDVADLSPQALGPGIGPNGAVTMMESNPWRVITPFRSALAPNDNPVAPGDAVMVAMRGGDRPALIQSLFTVSVEPRLGSMRVFAHVQWLISSYAGTELFLAAPGEERACGNVKVSQILYTLPEHPRFVFDGGWRDPLPPGPHKPEDTDADPAPHTRCDSCLASEAERLRQPKVYLDDEDAEDAVGVGFTRAGVEYHIGDLVFFTPADIASGQAWTPGILTHRSELGAGDLWLVRGCGWYADLEPKGYVDENRLFLTPQTHWVPLTAIMGKGLLNAKVRDAFTCRELLPPGGTRKALFPLPYRRFALPKACRECLAERAALGPLHELRPPAVDLYAGGGSLLHGLQRHFDVVHAVEMLPVACDTLRANYPRVTVHNAKVKRYTRSKHALPPGSCALLVAGPPCQGFTLANPNRRYDDTKSTEITHTLREAARLRPDVLVLENVPGILTPLPDGRGGAVHMMHRIVRALVGEMGYQVRYSELSSRAFGSPQHRRRVFVVAVRQGLPLPAFPRPTHANPNTRSEPGEREREPSPGEYVPPAVGDARRPAKGTGPRRAVTARDAIGDFPRWDYDRGAQWGGVVGLPNGRPYPHEPLTSFQRAARRRKKGAKRSGVWYHFTGHPSLHVLDLIDAAPLAFAARGGGRGTKLRLDPAGHVPTIMSSPWPGGKATRLIHWEQNRVLSVGERRRVQGLPDDYILRGSVAEKDQMLGNMVDVHIADALAAHIKREVFAPVWREMACPPPDVFWRLWRERFPVEVE